MNTPYMEQQKERHNEEQKSWRILITNRVCLGDKGAEVSTSFTSDKNTIEEALHKLELDIMTNIHHEIDEPIRIKVEVIKK